MAVRLDEEAIVIEGDVVRVEANQRRSLPGGTNEGEYQRQKGRR